MERYQLLFWALKAIWLGFIFAYGACVGSLINVIVYRVPLGLSIVTPPSRCPKCNTRLTWRENIPVLGWLLLRGKCRFCKAPISAEYPLVEAAVGLLFCLFYIAWYVVPDPMPHGMGAVWLGLDWAAVKPEWALNDAARTWPEFVVLLVLLGSLVAMTIIDARTFMIPLALTWVPAIVGIVGHTAHAAMVGYRKVYAAPGFSWAIPVPRSDGWGWIGVALGGVLGLGVGILLLRLGLIRRSFADYPEWEKKALEEQRASERGDAAPAAVVAPVAAESGGASGGASAVEVETVAAVSDSGPAELWIQYPHARREMIKELAFLAPCIGLALLGWYVGRWYGGVTYNPFLGMSVATKGAPLWLTVLAGTLLGYLIGGGVVWGVRILGSLGFGKEAMGLGDVHLMAAVGACLGWIDATLAFFGAAFVGLAWVALGSVVSGGVRRTMPYGPYLAVSTVLVLLFKPLIETGLSAMLGQPINIP